MAQWRAVRNDWNSDPLGSVARSIAAETTLLCFDELHITDLVSALFLSRLFTELFYLGVIIVTTSNKPLDQLWDSGPALHRDPVISTLNRAWQLHANVFEFHPKQDYRRSKPLNLDSFLNLEKRQDANKHLLRRFFSTKPCETAEEIQIFASPTRYISLRLLGRNGLATFDQLCGKPYGTAEYAALAESLDTLFLLDVPKFDDHNLGEGRRFILLIDQLYERRVALSISARADLTSMFDFSFLRNSERETHRFEEAVDDRTKLTSNSDPIVTHFDSSETAFMFNRAVSRIHELTSLNSSNKELGKK
jgi:predicted ATPase